MGNEQKKRGEPPLDLEEVLELAMPAEEYRKMWERTHELEEKKIRVLERIADLLDHWPHSFYR